MTKDVLPVDKPLISVVVPLYNEEEVIDESYKRLKAVLDNCQDSYELILVNDGSRDATLEKARAFAENDKTLRILSFSRNFGHQPAITAGLDYALGDAVIIIDADLQDPPEVIPDMIAKWKEGYKVVYGKRIKRKGETVFKKITAKLFYRFINSMSDVNLPFDAGDFRLLDRKVVDTLKSMPEHNRYMRGLVSWAGYRQTAVEYVREERFAGVTKYPFKKMLALGINGVTSFSLKPLKLSVYLGSVISFLSFVYVIYVFIHRIVNPEIAAGWASLAAITLFLNGIVLIMLGIVGQYIGRIYDETKARPLYIVDEDIQG
jgi:dolichol-phosphate mannosyltransferase